MKREKIKVKIIGTFNNISIVSIISKKIMFLNLKFEFVYCLFFINRRRILDINSDILIFENEMLYDKGIKIKGMDNNEEIDVSLIIFFSKSFFLIFIFFLGIIKIIIASNVPIDDIIFKF